VAFRSDPYFIKGIRVIFLVTAIVTIILCSLDLLTGPTEIDLRFWNNAITILIALLCPLIFQHKKSGLKKIYGILVSAIFANTIIDFSYFWHDSNFLGIFLRDSIYLGLLITMSAYMVSKTFSALLTALYICILLLVTFLSQNTFLLNNFDNILIVFLAFALVMFFFVGILEKVVNELHQFNQISKEQNEEIQMQNTELYQQREEITLQRDTLENQNLMIEKKNKDIFDNLLFAKSIQQSILPKEKDYRDYLPDSFIQLYPKDAISGDFYWINEKNGKIFIAAIDCTGHGASGALVSMIMYLTMNRVLSQLEEPTPSSMLNKLDSILIAEFNKDSIDFNDRIGMDISLISIDIENMSMQYAGAINPMYFVRNSKLLQFKASRHLLGIDSTEIFNYFENSTIDILPGDTIYLFSDGLPDQFGGPDGKKLGYRRFREFLEQISIEEMETQKSLISKFLIEWKGNYEQVDDILLIGIRF
jgi:serine phosphatase RsbU (regulator of sigma subunit)